MDPEVVGEHEGVVQNGELETAGFSGKYNPTTRKQRCQNPEKYDLKPALCRSILQFECVLNLLWDVFYVLQETRTNIQRDLLSLPAGKKSKL